MSSKFYERGIVAGICVGLITLVWFVFGQTIRFPFINFDDPEYVYEVPEINSGLSWHNVAWAFTHWPSTNWFPLKNISHMFEFQFYGSNPGLFHLTNVILHTIAVVLLFEECICRCDLRDSSFARRIRRLDRGTQRRLKRRLFHAHARGLSMVHAQTVDRSVFDDVDLVRCGFALEANAGHDAVHSSVARLLATQQKSHVTRHTSHVTTVQLAETNL